MAGSIVFLVLAVVALGAAGVVLALKAHAAQRAEVRRQAILHAARQEAVNLMSLDYRGLDRDIDLVLDGATGSFKDQWAVASRQLKDVLVKAKTVSEGKILETGLVSADEDSAEVLLVVDETVKSSNAPEGVLRHYRMRMELDRVGDRWLVSKLEFVP